MDEREYSRIVAAVMVDETPLSVNISIMQAWLLVSALQLATRHPDLGKPMKTHLTAIARQFQESIVEVHPEAKAVLEMGWHSEYDR